MEEPGGGPIPRVDEQKRALAALWIVGTVGAVAFAVYDRGTPETELPLVLIPALYVALLGATAAVWWVARD